ncbi:MAG: hypothetical protein WDA10_00305 [Porticoccaceae bacterium]|jgi:hypothetical protein
MADPLILEKVTLLYVVEEDRIKLQGQTKGNDKITLWFTQRLFLRLIPMLIRHLDQRVDVESDLPRKVSSPSQRAAMQSFLQDKAMAGRGAAAPVVIDDQPLIDQLVVTLDLSQQRRGVVLKFPVEGERLVALPLTQDYIRHWLSVVYGLFVKASWPLDVWPEWVKEAHRRDAKPSLDQLH